MIFVPRFAAWLKILQRACFEGLSQASFIVFESFITNELLVAPKLKFGNTENRILYGPVLTSFANPIHIKDQCQTPISMQTDPNYSASTCISLEHAGQSYDNLQCLPYLKD